MSYDAAAAAGAAPADPLEQPVAGPSTERDPDRKKKQRRPKKKTNNDNSSNMDIAPVASTSQAVYVPPTADVQRYSRGKPASTKTVCRCYLKYFQVDICI